MFQDIDATCDDWIAKLKSMVEVWKKQAETAEKVQAAIAAGPATEGGAPPPEMSLEDLEASVVTARDNVPIRLADIARVNVGPAERRGLLDKAGAEVAVALGDAASSVAASPMTAGVLSGVWSSGSLVCSSKKLIRVERWSAVSRSP